MQKSVESGRVKWTSKFLMDPKFLMRVLGRMNYDDKNAAIMEYK